MYSSGSNPVTDEANRVEYRLVSNVVIVVTPDLPASMFSQKGSTPSPRDVITPNPVITTLWPPASPGTVPMIQSSPTERGGVICPNTVGRRTQALVLSSMYFTAS